MMSTMQEMYTTFREAVKTLTERAPGVAEALGEREVFCDRRGWRALEGKPRALAEKEGKPLLVATLFGPTGAGKSTLFKTLTGLAVPAGAVPRPRSYVCCVAVPNEIADEEQMRNLFPEWECERLEDVRVLEDKQQPKEKLMYASYDRERGEDHVWLMLADVPDFNSVERCNWARAELMAARAEIVIFVVTEDLYCDVRVFDQLRQCCGGSGQLVYVITKTNASNADEIWRDVVRRTREELAEWQARRSDERTLAEYLEAAQVYWSPRKEGDGVVEVWPVNPSTPAFESLLKGEDALRVLLSNLLEIGQEGIRASTDLVRKAEQRREELQQRIEYVEGLCREQARYIAGKEFPLGRVLQMTLDTLRAEQPLLVKMLRPMSWIVRQMVQKISALWNYLTENREALRNREELEQERIRTAVERIIDAVRARYAENGAEAQRVTQQRKEELREACGTKELPDCGVQWEYHVKKELQKWVQEHKWRAMLYGSLTELLTIAGGAAVVVDLCIDGGAFMGMGIVAVAGAGGMLAGLITSTFEYMKMKKVLETADNEWRVERAAQLEEHLKTHLAKPLITGQDREELKQIEASGIEACRQACQELERVINAMRGGTCITR